MATKTTETSVLHFRLDAELHDRLRAVAKAHDRSTSGEARRAIEARVEKFEREQAEASA